MPGEPWTDAGNVIVEAGGFVRITPVNTSENNECEIISLGSKSDFLMSSEEIDIYSNFAAGEPEYKYKTLANGTTLRVEKLSPMIDAASGALLPKDKGSADKFHIRLLCGKSQKDLLVGWIRSGRALIACISLGINAIRANTGFAHLLCRIGGDIKESRKDEISELSFTLKGGRAFSIKETAPGTPDVGASDYNASSCGSGNPIEPVGKNVTIIKTISAGDWNIMLTGRIARTDNV